MAGVFQNIDPPSPSPPGECVPAAFGAGEGHMHSLGGEGGGGSIFWKTSDTALYSTYVSTLCLLVSLTSVSLRKYCTSLTAKYLKQFNIYLCAVLRSRGGDVQVQKRSLSYKKGTTILRLLWLHSGVEGGGRGVISAGNGEQFPPFLTTDYFLLARLSPAFTCQNIYFCTPTINRAGN
jgi:hypothetical protein